MEQRTPLAWKSSRWDRVEQFNRIERFRGWISFVMHHQRPAAVDQRSHSIRLGTRSSRRVRRWCVVRPTSTQSDTMGPLTYCGGPLMVHNERDSAAESFNSTELLDPIPADWFPWSALFHREKLGETQIFHRKSENLWKSFNNYLWTLTRRVIGGLRRRGWYF